MSRVKQCAGRGKGAHRVACGRVLPADAKHFCRKADTKDGLTSACRQCINAYNLAHLHRKRAEAPRQPALPPGPPPPPELDEHAVKMARIAAKNHTTLLFDRRPAPEGGWIHLYIDETFAVTQSGPYSY